MEEVTDLHRQAMALVDAAASARRLGEPERAIALLRQAFELEAIAALRVRDRLELEPTRSVLHRSAASLALQCEELRTAEQLISQAMAGNPPEEIAEELRDLWEQTNFQRHLKLRGITLQPNEFQMSLSGPLVGFGIALSGQLVNRVRYLESLLYRTAERKLNKPFREHGRRKKGLEADIQLFLSVPRAASFAISFRLGSSEQLKLPGVDFTEEVVGEVIECLDLLSKDEIEPLKARMPDEPYFVNFMALATNIAPDGEVIRSVGLTSVRGGKERKVVLSTPRERIARTVSPKALDQMPEVEGRVEVRGTLRLADARSENEGLIEIIDEKGSSHRVKVPRGMMSDIVRPMFDLEVVVVGRPAKQLILLEDIHRAEE